MALLFIVLLGRVTGCERHGLKRRLKFEHLIQENVIFSKNQNLRKISRKILQFHWLTDGGDHEE